LTGPQNSRVLYAVCSSRRSPSRHRPASQEGFAPEGGSRKRRVSGAHTSGTPNFVAGALGHPQPGDCTLPLSGERLIAITLIFRHIFWRQTTTTVRRQPVVKLTESRCGAKVSTTNDNCPQLSTQNQRVGGSIPSRRTISAGHRPAGRRSSFREGRQTHLIPILGLVPSLGEVFPRILQCLSNPGVHHLATAES
jgi:hypothetical protein